MAQSAAGPYEVLRCPGCNLGGIVHTFDLRSSIGDPGLISLLREDLATYRLLVFRGQDKFTPADHLALSESLGCMDHGLHTPHPQSPDPRLLRISNRKEDGFVMAGVSGWHVDGFMLQVPFAVQTMHFISAIPGGDTLFLGLREFLASLELEVLERFRRLWFISGVGKDLATGQGQVSILPLVYKHPKTGEETMCFHLGPGYCLGWLEERQAGGLESLMGNFMGGLHVGGPEAKRAQEVLQRLLCTLGDKPGDYDYEFHPPKPLQDMIASLISNIGEDVRRGFVWRQEWQAGDVALIDNLALAHLATPGTQAPADGPDGVGLRLFHRTTMVDRSLSLPRNTRGAAPVLLCGGTSGGVTSAKTGSRAGAVEDTQAMRLIIRALLAFQEDGGVPGSKAKQEKIQPPEEAPKAIVPSASLKATAAKLRSKVKAAKDSTA